MSLSSTPSYMPEAERLLASVRPRYHLPTHIQVPDTLEFPLLGFTIRVTLRQAVLLFFGWSTAFDLWKRLAGLDQLGRGGLILHIVLPVLLGVTTVCVAVCSIAGRPLEAWAVVLLRYYTQASVYLHDGLDDRQNDQHGAATSQEEA